MTAPEPGQSIPVVDVSTPQEEDTSTLSPLDSNTWYKDLPPDYHAIDHVKNHEDLESFVRESVNAQQMIGRKGIIPPNEDSSIDDWGKFYEQLGRPSDIESYDPSQWEDVGKDELPRDQNFEQSLAKELYDSGLSEKQAKRLWNFYIEGTANQFNQQMSAHNELSQNLDERLTEAYGDNRDVKLSYARKAWAELGGKIGVGSDEWLGFLEQPMANGQRLGDQWPLIQAFVALGESTQESQMQGNKFDSNANARAVTPETAREELARIMADPEFTQAWGDEKNDKHDQAIDEVNRLHNLIYGK